ncbi:MAG: SMP-30/gluconolactonase/LRE family protein, partial [Byssovorax sp.]
MLKRALSLGLIATTFLLAGCGDGGSTSSTTGSGTSGSGGAGGSGGSTGTVGAGGDGGSSSSSSGSGGAGGGVVNVDPLVGAGAVEKVQDKFMFTEGPQWIPATKTLLFTDVPASRIYEHTPGAGIAVFREPSANSNGLALDPDGLLIACEHSGRRVSRTLADGKLVPVADAFEGKKLNSPNDVIVRKDGSVYFTDPPYGLPDPGQSELGFFGVFRVAPGGKVEAIAKDMNRPNGIALSPDEN